MKWGKINIVVFVLSVLIFSCQESQESTIVEPETGVPIDAELDSAYANVILSTNSAYIRDSLSVKVKITSSSFIQHVQLFINDKSDSTLVLLDPPYEYKFRVVDIAAGNRLKIYAEVKSNNILVRSYPKYVQLKFIKTPSFNLIVNERVNLSWNSDFPLPVRCNIFKKTNNGNFELLADLPNNIRYFYDEVQDTNSTYSYRAKIYVDTLLVNKEFFEESGYTGTISIKHFHEYEKLSAQLNGAHHSPNIWGDRTTPIIVNRNVNYLGFAFENTKHATILKWPAFLFYDLYTGPDDIMMSLSTSKTNNYFWFGSTTDKIYRINGFNGADTGFKIFGDSVTSTCENPFNNTLLYGTVDGYLGNLVIDNGTIDFYRKLGNEEIRRIVVPTEEDVYFIKRNQFLYRYNTNNSLLDSLNLGHNITDMIYTENNLFISFDDGLLYYKLDWDGKELKAFEQFQLSKSKIWDLDFANNKLVAIDFENRIQICEVKSSSEIEVKHILEFPYNGWGDIEIACNNGAKSIFVSNDRKIYFYNYISGWDKF